MEGAGVIIAMHGRILQRTKDPRIHIILGRSTGFHRPRGRGGEEGETKSKLGACEA